MQLRDIAWESLKRRRGRFAFIVTALMLGVGTVVALVSLSRAMQADVSDELDRFGANIIITPKSRALDLAYGGVAVGGLTVDVQDLNTEDATLIRTIPNKRNISAVAPKVVGTTEIDGKRALVIGARFDQEPGIKSWWQIDGRFARGGDEALLGTEAAQNLGKHSGETLALGGRQLRVAGVIAPTGSIDDQAVFVDLGLAQRVLGKPGKVSLIEVSALCRGCPIEDIVSQISAALPHARVAPIRQAVAAREQAVRQLTRFTYAVSFVVLLVGTLVVMTTMMSSVTERTQEIGILRAVGFRQAHVARVILLETVVINVAGGLLGWVAGSIGARLLGPALAQLSSPIPLDPGLLVLAVVIATLVGVTGGAYAAARAARMDPAEALRHM
ncbi:MAG: ABC transporter permease [Acidobacteria bacterium]|nr:ABC transporter permease [Acidobacteriota bacterium]